MVVVYSGFWILYFQNFGSVLWYLRDFVDPAPVSAAVNSLLRALGLPGGLRIFPTADLVIAVGASRPVHRCRWR